MIEVKISLVPESMLPDHISKMDEEMREWTDKAARGECAWICSDCCCSDQKGMPDACFHGDQTCTEIIQRDKSHAMREGNEPK